MELTGVLAGFNVEKTSRPRENYPMILYFSRHLKSNFMIAFALIFLNSALLYAEPRFQIEHRNGKKGVKYEAVVYVDDSKSPPLEIDVGRIETIKQGTPLFHWGEDWQIAWAANGFPDTEDNKSHRKLQSGYFVSSNITDSSSYGPVLVVNVPVKNLRIALLDWKANPTAAWSVSNSAAQRCSLG